MERDTDQSDPQQAFYDSVIRKYADEDAREMAKEDGVETPAKAEKETPAPTTAAANDTADQTDAKDTAAHTESGTSSDAPDGETDEPADDADADDDEGHPDDEEEDVDEPTDDDESEDDDTADEEEDDDEVTDETKAALTSKGADLSLDDIPKEYQGPIKAKLRGIDAAFSRQSAENTAFRAERTRFQAEEQFRAENPELVIVELLQKGGADLFEKVDARLAKLDDPDNAEAFEIIVRDKRQGAVIKLEAQQTAAEQLVQRANYVYETAVKLGRKHGLTPELADRAVERVLLQKPQGERDVSDAEIAAAIKEAAALQSHVTRDARRTMSKDIIKNRTASRKAVNGTGKRPPVAAAPRPSGEKPEKVNYGSEASRHAAMMKTARRLMPGTR